MTEACAAIVERDDPHLYATALFAPEPARSRLMVLYAFDCELSRATRSSKESMIPRMRLQWWRDVVEEAASGMKPKAHEVAEPLARLFRLPAFDPGLAPAPFLAMIAGYEAELSAPFTSDSYQQWAKDRFAGRVAAALRLLDPAGTRDLDSVAHDACMVLAAGFAIRTAQGRAAATAPVLVPNVSGPQIGQLARGEAPADLHRILIKMATDAEDAAIRLRSNLAKSWTPALLPLVREKRALAMVRAANFVFTDLERIDRPFDGLRLAWRAVTGRW